MIRNQTLDIDLIVFRINHFNVIIGMDWLTKYRVHTHCSTKIENVLQFPYPPCKVIYKKDTYTAIRCDMYLIK